jgi:CheY-like chemotaxis protein
MVSLNRNVSRSRTCDLSPILSVDVDRLDFRSALVIEESSTLRSSIVQLLKKRGWIAHGIKNTAQAFPLLKCIPYHLIVVDGNSASVDAINFARTLRKSEGWNKIPLVIIADLPNASLISHLANASVRSARKSAWLSDLVDIVADLEHGRWGRNPYAS